MKKLKIWTGRSHPLSYSLNRHRHLSSLLKILLKFSSSLTISLLILSDHILIYHFFNLQKCNLGSPEDFLSKALDPPQLQVISNAMNLLRKIGACELNEPKLTPLGQHLAALPVNVKIGKMLIFGAIFGCLDPVVRQTTLLLLHCKYHFSWGSIKFRNKF